MRALVAKLEEVLRRYFSR